jgi:hypothetical protein
LNGSGEMIGLFLSRSESVNITSEVVARATISAR